jgi:hypothetical protein
MHRRDWLKGTTAAGLALVAGRWQLTAEEAATISGRFPALADTALEQGPGAGGFLRGSAHHADGLGVALRPRGDGAGGGRGLHAGRLGAGAGGRGLGLRRERRSLGGLRGRPRRIGRGHRQIPGRLAETAGGDRDAAGLHGALGAGHRDRSVHRGTGGKGGAPPGHQPRRARQGRELLQCAFLPGPGAQMAGQHLRQPDRAVAGADLSQLQRHGDRSEEGRVRLALQSGTAARGGLRASEGLGFRRRGRRSPSSRPRKRWPRRA